MMSGPHKRCSGAAARCRRHRGSGDARRRRRRSPRTKPPPNGLTRKCSSEHRPGPGFRTAKSERPLRAQGSGDMPRIKSPHQRTGAVAGLCNAKSESDFRRGRVSGAAERQRVCEANEQRRRPAEACRAGLPLKGAVTK